MIFRKAIQLSLGLLVCLTALALPYRARLVFYSLVSAAVHLPVVLFARAARKLMSDLDDKERT